MTANQKTSTYSKNRAENTLVSVELTECLLQQHSTSKLHFSTLACEQQPTSLCFRCHIKLAATGVSLGSDSEVGVNHSILSSVHFSSYKKNGDRMKLNNMLKVMREIGSK